MHTLAAAEAETATADATGIADISKVVGVNERLLNEARDTLSA